MRPEGSPLTGLRTILAKEAADHLTSARMGFLQLLIALAGGGAVYVGIEAIREKTAEDPFLLLRLFTAAQDPLPSFVAFLGFLVPLTAIALGFDAVNTEFSRRTLSRILAQPVYRDAFLFGKFLAALLTLAVSLLALWLLVAGLGMLLLGVPPSGEEVLRSLVFFIATIAYAAVWLSLALLFSTIFRQPATSAFAALAVWLVLTVFWPMITGLIAHGAGGEATGMEGLTTELWLSRLSPNTLYGEAALGLLNPDVRTLGPIFLYPLEGMVLGAPLPFGESFKLVWPQIVGLIAATILMFTATYVIFQRQEIRA